MVLHSVQRPIPSDHIPGDNPRVGLANEVNSMSRRMFVCVCVAFRSLHIVAWNFAFPTEIERILWRTASVSSCVLPLCFGDLLLVRDRVFVRSSTFQKVKERAIDGSCWLYIIVRVYMFVEMFVGLRAVPADVYKTVNWAQYLPSFG
jgi:hypothetical protein